MEILSRFQILYQDYIQAYPDSLQDVTDLLQEKEVRLRTPLEELDLLLANRPMQDQEGQIGGSDSDSPQEDLQ